MFVRRYPLFTATALLVAIATTGFFVAPAWSADPPSAAAGKATPAPALETFLRKAAAGNSFEIESSKLALARSGNASVKAFAQLMVTDHGKAAEKMKQATAEAKITAAPAKLEPAQEKIMGQLQTLQGGAFDKAYILAQREAHAETVALFRAYAEGGDNTRMKKFAAEMLPELEEHARHTATLDAPA